MTGPTCSYPQADGRGGMKRTTLIATAAVGFLLLGASTAFLVLPPSKGEAPPEETTAASLHLGEVRLGDRFQYVGRVVHGDSWWQVDLAGEWKGLVAAQ